jgi:hypothetical protein
MGDSKKGKHTNRLAKKNVELTPEQQAAALQAAETKRAEQKAEQERLRLYGAALETMSHRQLRRELTKTIRREYAGRPPEPQAGLTIALGTILLTVLDNTQTKENPFAKLSSYPR